MADSSSSRSTRTVGAALQSAAAARGRARQFWRVFDKSLVPMLTVDNERRYLNANAATRLAFRLSLAEMRRRRIDDLTPEYMLPELHQRWAQLMRAGFAAGIYDIGFDDGSHLKAVYGALANVLPGEHLVVFAPADWGAEELQAREEDRPAALEGPLSGREREVLTLVAAGSDFKQIADELTISPATVRTHAQNAMRKLGARNRPHAIALAMQASLIDLPPAAPRSTD